MFSKQAARCWFTPWLCLFALKCLPHQAAPPTIEHQLVPWIPPSSAQGRPNGAVEHEGFEELAYFFRFDNGEAVDIDLVDYH